MATLKPDAAEDVLVYRLYEQEVLDDRAGAVARGLAAQGAVEPWFESLPGGCFRWEDEARGRGPGGGGLVATAGAARDAAAAFMQATNEAAGRSGASERGLRPFATESLRPLEVRSVPTGARARAEHWVTRWALFLPPTPGPERDRTPVVGATVDVRVAANGQVFGVVSRARPWSSVAARPALEWSADGHAATHEHADPHGSHTGHEHAAPGGDHAQRELVYVCDSPEEPQRFYAPCWLIPPEDEESHHARRLWPASDHTILPEILVDAQDGGGTAWAQVLGPRGRAVVIEDGDEWSVGWSVADLQEYVDGARRVFTATSAPLPSPGVFQVELEVVHRPTGAIRTTHRQVSIGAPRPESTQRRTG